MCEEYKKVEYLYVMLCDFDLKMTIYVIEGDSLWRPFCDQMKTVAY